VPITCKLEDERGEMLDEANDQYDLLHRLLARPDEASKAVRFIDWYGDTTFNKLQMEPFIKEWKAFLDGAKSDDERGFLDAVLRMAKECREGVHLYLKFYGD